MVASLVFLVITIGLVLIVYLCNLAKRFWLSITFSVMATISFSFAIVCLFEYQENKPVKQLNDEIVRIQKLSEALGGIDSFLEYERIKAE